MKRFLAILISCALLLTPLTAQAADAFSTGDRGDGVLRVQLRLQELGYLTAPVTGVWRAADTAALAAYAAAGGAEDGLFSTGAPHALETAMAADNAAAAATNVVYGGAMPWGEIKTRLNRDRRYQLTDCYTGVAVWLMYLGGEHYALMQPVLTWDGATLTSLFSGDTLLETRPAVLSVDGMLAAASIRLKPLGAEDGTAQVELFFTGSGTALSGLPDADHERAVRIAATAP